MTTKEREAAFRRVDARYERMGATWAQFKRMRRACFPVPYATETLTDVSMMGLARGTFYCLDKR